MDIDLGLLLATVATAAAALVAIVGGLLVSRVVSLASERSGLIHRRDDLRGQLATERERRDELDRRWVERDADDILSGHYEELAAVPPQVALEEWIAEDGANRTSEEVLPFVEEVVRELAEAREALEPIFTPDGTKDTLSALERSGMVTIPPGKRAYYEGAYDRLEREYPYKPPPDPFGVGALAPIQSSIDYSRLTAAPIVAGSHARYHQLVRDADEAHHRVASVEVQLEQAELALARVSRPVGVGAGVGVLAYFGTVGTLVPFGMMMFEPRLKAGAGWTAIGLFASGLAALLGYVIWQVNHLTDDPAALGATSLD
jgi:hypothetical protein